jgi:hypothetical protein
MKIKEVSRRNVLTSGDSNSDIGGSIKRICRELKFLYEKVDNSHFELLISEGKAGS